MTVREMLGRILPRRGFVFRYIARGTILVERTPWPPPHPPELTAAQSPSVMTGSGEIIVTATRREERLSDLPMSVASFGQDALDARGGVTMSDLARLTPGVVLRGGWGLSTNLSIRGIYSNSGSATIGLYLDDTPIQSRALGAGLTATNIYPAIFDLERVEVIQGPQGALFGSGSVGGTVRFITKGASTDRTEANGQVELRSTRHGGIGYEARLVLGGPIAADRVGVRFSAFSRRESGWVDRVDGASGQIVSADSNVTTTQAFRLASLVRIGEDVTIRANLQYQRTSQEDTDLFAAPISDPLNGVFQNRASLAQPALDTFVMPSIRMDATLGTISVSSSTSYFGRRRPSTMDYTNFLIEYVTLGRRFTLEEVPQYRAPVHFENEQDIFTQEFRFTSGGRGATRWVAGLFLQQARQYALEVISEPLLDRALEALIGQSANSYFGSPTLENGVSYIGADRSWDSQVAIFGQIEHDVRPDFTITVGGRLSRTHFDQVNQQDGPQSGGRLQSQIENSDTPFLPRFSIAWRAFPHGMFYLSAARGSRIGGANPHVSPVRCGAQLARYGYTEVPEQYASDSIWNYEVGGRADSIDGSFSLQASAFLFHWQNVQQNFSLRCLFRFTANSPSARGYGGDFSLNWKPNPSLSIAASASYTHASYNEASYGGIINDQTGERAVLSTAGGTLPAPPFRLNVFAHQEFDLGDALNAYVSVNGEYAAGFAVGRPPGAVGHDPLTYRLPATRNISIRGGLRRGQVEATVFVENLLDFADATQIARTFVASPNSTMSVTRPRTIGVRLGYAFK
jgi:iron complex outermembrane receptor protein